MGIFKRNKEAKYIYIYNAFPFGLYELQKDNQSAAFARLLGFCLAIERGQRSAAHTHTHTCMTFSGRRMPCLIVSRDMLLLGSGYPIYKATQV